MQQLIDYIQAYVKLDIDALRDLEELAEIESYSKNQFVLEQGQRCNKIWFVKSGMIRKYYLHDGKEKTVWMYTENETFTSLQSYSLNQAADEYIQACEDTTLISISKTNSEKLVQHPSIERFTSVLMGQEFASIDIHSKAFSTLDAKGRYEYLQNTSPEIIKRAKLGHIASILGISQETLSRIRKG